MECASCIVPIPIHYETHGVCASSKVQELSGKQGFVRVTLRLEHSEQGPALHCFAWYYFAREIACC